MKIKIGFGKKLSEKSNDELKHQRTAMGITAISVLILCMIPVYLNAFISSKPTETFQLAFSIFILGLASVSIQMIEMSDIRTELRIREVLANEHNGKPERSIQ